MAHPGSAEWTPRRGEALVPGRTVKSALGGSGRSQAFLTWNEGLERTTVVKVLRPDRLNDGGARRRMRREAELLAELDDPRIHRILDRDVEGPLPFIELEFVPGLRLSTVLRRHGRLDDASLIQLGRALAATVDVLHRRQLLHLDVKPRNIIMGPTPRLIDMSIARRFSDVAHIRSPIGTDAYMAPEQCDRARLTSIGPAADLWGIGVTLYQAASTRLPYPRGRRGGSDEERWPQLTHDPVPLRGRVSPRVGSLVTACLAPEPRARPTSSELVDQFHELA